MEEKEITCTAHPLGDVHINDNRRSQVGETTSCSLPSPSDACGKSSFLSEIRVPHFVFSESENVAQITLSIDMYLKNLEVLRLQFVEFIASCREAVASAYLEELLRARKILERRIEIDGSYSANFLQKDIQIKNLRKRFLFGMSTSLERAIDFVTKILPNFATLSINSQTTHAQEPREARAPQSKLQKRLEDYKEFLSVKDLCEIFQVKPRTVYNWERQGLLINLSNVSDEVNSLGRKKRGQDKKYRKETVVKNVALQEKYNELR